MGSGVSHVTVSLIVHGKVKRLSINHIFLREMWPEAGSRTCVLPLTSRARALTTRPSRLTQEEEEKTALPTYPLDVTAGGTTCFTSWLWGHNGVTYAACFMFRVVSYVPLSLGSGVAGWSFRRRQQLASQTVWTVPHTGSAWLQRWCELFHTLARPGSRAAVQLSLANSWLSPGRIKFTSSNWHLWLRMRTPGVLLLVTFEKMRF